MSDLRIATRSSQLAMTQARWVAERVLELQPDLDIELVEISTTGDIDRKTPVTALTEMGAFVRAVQQAVLDDRADLAVHSCKDLPTDGPADLMQWYPAREEPWDVLCGARLDELTIGARVGTGSPRRAAQLNLLRPDIEVVPIRGNVPTRLGKIGSEVDAVVLAEAGLIRLGLLDSVAQRFALDEMVPAPAQAALCIEAEGNDAVRAVLDALDDADTRVAVEAERQLLAETGAGCRSALGALVTSNGSSVTMAAFVQDDRGPRRATVRASDSERLAPSMRRELGL